MPFKTQLPANITTAQEAETFLRSLWTNGEAFHWDDSPKDIIWGEPEPTEAELTQLAKLMDQSHEVCNKAYPRTEGAENWGVWALPVVEDMLADIRKQMED
jgi:hypothetical protein